MFLFFFLPLGLLSFVAGCPQKNGHQAPEPEPPMEIYVDPVHEPKASQASEDPDADPPAPTSDSSADEGPTFNDPNSLRPPEKPSSTNPAEEFRNTLEGIPGEPSAETGEGVQGAGGCEGGTRAVGESWKRKCNTCICERSGEVACTLMACAGTYPE